MSSGRRIKAGGHHTRQALKAHINGCCASNAGEHCLDLRPLINNTANALSNKQDNLVTTLSLYPGAALAEIAGCFAFWAWLRLGKSVFWLNPGLLALAVFAGLLGAAIILSRARATQIKLQITNS